MTVSPPPTPPHGTAVNVFADQVLGFFRLLSDRTRLSILLLLRDGEKNVTTLCDHLKLPQPTVSHHLGLLRNNQLIENRRAGKQIFYGLSRRFMAGADGSIQFHCEVFRMRLEPSMTDASKALLPSALNIDVAAAPADGVIGA